MGRAFCFGEVGRLTAGKRSLACWPEVRLKAKGTVADSGLAPELKTFLWGVYPGGGMFRVLPYQGRYVGGPSGGRFCRHRRQNSKADSSCPRR